MPPQHRTFFPTKTVYVLTTGIQQNARVMAEVMDAQTRTSFMVPWIAPHRILPQPGDVWTLDQTGGSWRFQSLLRPGRIERTSTIRRVLGVLTKLGLIAYVPGDAPDATAVEAPHLAYVGETRLFFGTIPDGWFACDGSEVSRTQEALLFAQIGTTQGIGDGSTTYNLPTIADVGTGVYAICAR